MSFHSKNPRFTAAILTDHTAASVDNPASGSHKIVNRSGVLYMRDNTGAEVVVGTSAGTDSYDDSAGSSGVTLVSTDENIHTFTPSSNITVKLDSSFAQGRTISIFNEGSSNAVITVTANDDSTIIRVGVGGFVELIVETATPVDSGEWRVKYAKPDSFIRLDDGNGHGSTNTKIRRFTNITEQAGGDITYADSAANGASLTINQAGVYSMTYSDYSGSASYYIGISLNSAQLTTDVISIDVADRLALGFSSVNEDESVSVTMKLSSGDVIRPHTDGDPDNSGSRVQFSIAQVSKL